MREKMYQLLECLDDADKRGVPRCSPTLKAFPEADYRKICGSL
jgi:hypothetical protein